MLGIGVDVLHGGEGFSDGFDFVGRGNGAEPCVPDIGVGGVDVIGFLELSALRGIHGIEAQGAAADQVDARVAGVGGFGSFECL